MQLSHQKQRLITQETRKHRELQKLDATEIRNSVICLFSNFCAFVSYILFLHFTQVNGYRIIIQ